MNKSDKVGFYGDYGYGGDHPSSDHNFFYSQNRSDLKNPLQPQQGPDYNNNWGNNAPHKNNPLGFNGISPMDVINFMENNLKKPPQQNYQNTFDYPEKPPARGPRTSE